MTDSKYFTTTKKGEHTYISKFNSLLCRSILMLRLLLFLANMMTMRFCQHCRPFTNMTSDRKTHNAFAVDRYHPITGKNNAQSGYVLGDGVIAVQ